MKFKILTLVLFLFSSSNFVSNFVSAAESDQDIKEFDSENLKELIIQNTSGNVGVTVASGKNTKAHKAKVTAKKIKFGKNCRMTVEKQGKSLLVEVKKTESLSFEDSCEVDFAIEVPAAINLDLNSGSGDYSIKGTKGNLDFTIGSGEILLDGMVNEVNGTIGSGNIKIKSMSGGGHLKSGSGDIHVSYTSLSQKSQLDLKTGSGNTTLFLPKATKIKTSFFSGSGSLTNELGDSDKAQLEISMMAGSGDLHIKKL